MRVPAPPRLAQLAHLFQVNPAAVFGNKSTLISSFRRHHNHHQDPFGTSTPLPSPTTSTSSVSASTNSESSSSSSSDADPTFDAETVPDDRTLVEEESRRRSSSSHSDGEVDEAGSLILLTEIPEEEASYLKSKRRRSVPSSRGRGQRPAFSSERPDTSARLSIIYPLPSAESLLAAPTHGPTPSATVIDASIGPPLCTPSPLSPPPAHYKRRRARIMSDEDHDSEAPIRYVSCHVASLRNTGADDGIACRFLADPESTLRFPF
jgi:hypothetical protein